MNGEDTGMHMVRGGSEHGPYRLFHSNGCIICGTMRGNRVHGLRIYALKSEIRLQVYRNGNIIFYLYFDCSGKVSNSYDEEGLFDGVKA